MTEGIPYFSLDCRFDDKLEEIEDMFGMKGLGIIIKLFQQDLWYTRILLRVERQGGVKVCKP